MKKERYVEIIHLLLDSGHAEHAAELIRDYKVPVTPEEVMAAHRRLNNQQVMPAVKVAVEPKAEEPVKVPTLVPNQDAWDHDELSDASYSRPKWRRFSTWFKGAGYYRSAKTGEVSFVCTSLDGNIVKYWSAKAKY